MARVLRCYQSVSIPVSTGLLNKRCHYRAGKKGSTSCFGHRLIRRIELWLIRRDYSQ